MSKTLLKSLKEFFDFQMKGVPPSQIPSLAKKTIMNDDKKESFLDFTLQLNFQKERKKSAVTLRKKLINPKGSDYWSKQIEIYRKTSVQWSELSIKIHCQGANVTCTLNVTKYFKWGICQVFFLRQFFILMFSLFNSLPKWG